MSNHEITFNTNASGTPITRADFSYNITPATISIVDTGLGKCAVTEGYRGGLTENRVLAPGIDPQFQDHA
jgi:hypothetical protein